MINRRQFIGGSISGFYAFAARHQFAGLLSGVAGTTATRGRAKRCIVLWMEGGPSQLDTIDPKPGTPTGGPFRPIATSAAGIQISQALPKLARQMKHLSVIRNLASSEADHVRASYCLHTGYSFEPSFPRPALGSVVSHQTATADFPNFVSLGSPGHGPAYLGPEHAPFSVSDLVTTRELINSIRLRSNRLGLLQQLDQPFSDSHHDRRVELRRAALEKIQRLASTNFSDALDIQSVSAADRARYGGGPFADRCLAARRLLDLGVTFVEVQQSGWDTHTDNFNGVRQLCEQIDRPFAALVEDLHASGMYDETLILWLGEFGRTPQINAQQGRDHFPLATPVIIGGGPISASVAVGKTNELGTQIDGPSYRVADLFATVFAALGIAPNQEFTTDFDSPTSATDNGQIIKELLPD